MHEHEPICQVVYVLVLEDRLHYITASKELIVANEGNEHLLGWVVPQTSFTAYQMHVRICVRNKSPYIHVAFIYIAAHNTCDDAKLGDVNKLTKSPQAYEQT